MFEQIKNNLPEFWDKYQHLFKEMKVPEKTILLHEGEVSGKLYFIKNGCP